MNWGEAYTKWLRRRGVPIEEIGIHVRVASRIVAEAGDAGVQPKHVYQARATAIEQGNTSAQLESFDALAAVFMEFQSELNAEQGEAEGAAPDDAIDLGGAAPDDAIDLGGAAPDDAIDLGDAASDDAIDLDGAAPDDAIDLQGGSPDDAIDLEAGPPDDAIDLEAGPPDDAIDLESPSAGPGEADAKPPPGHGWKNAPRTKTPAEASTEGPAPRPAKPSGHGPWKNAEPGPVAAEPEVAAPAPAAKRDEAARARPPRPSRPGGAHVCRHCGSATTIDYGQRNLAISAVLIAVVGAALGFYVGVLGATALLLFATAIATGMAIVLATYRCTSCGSLVETERQTPQESDALKATRRRLAIATVIAAVGGVVMGLAWFVGSSTEADPREALLVSTVEAVAHRIESDRMLRQQARRFDPELKNESVIMTFYSAEYTARTPAPPEGIDICQSPPERPFCVVVRPGDGAHTVIVEGYGANRETIIAREVLEIWPH